MQLSGTKDGLRVCSVLPPLFLVAGGVEATTVTVLVGGAFTTKETDFDLSVLLLGLAGSWGGLTLE